MLESCKQKIISMIFRVGKNSNRSILRSLAGLVSMEFRWKWLLTRYLRRLDRLPHNFLISNSLKSKRSYLKKLEKCKFQNGLSKESFELTDLTENNQRTIVSTATHLNLTISNKVANFLNSNQNLSSRDLRIICLWLLKKFPARAPKTCMRCQSEHGTQAHNASCNDILETQFPDIQPRWRLEHGISVGFNLEVIL